MILSYVCTSHMWEGGSDMYVVCGLNTLRPSDIYVSVNWVISAFNNGLSLVQCQAIISANDDILSIQPIGTNLNEI